PAHRPARPVRLVPRHQLPRPRHARRPRTDRTPLRRRDLIPTPITEASDMAHLPPVPNQDVKAAEDDPPAFDEEDRQYTHERLIFSSDAVIAIAMTLLALELPVPKGRTDAEVWRSFAEKLHGEYLTFIISFAVIGAFWVAHHQLFRKIHLVDLTLRRL